MARYREFRKIDSDMVRSMCIRESYYTRGDVDAYTHLLVDLCDFKKEITMDDLEEITEDILKYIEYAREKGCSLTGSEDPDVQRLNVVNENTLDWM